MQRTLGLPDQPPIARAGQAFVRDQLTPEALSCYWLGALQRYSELYFLPQTPAQAAAAGGGGGSGAGAAADASGGQGSSSGGSAAAGSATQGSQTAATAAAAQQAG